ncbi:MAG: hypothetical protein AAB449_02995 [Patescibacteria group bacterium]
MRTSPLLLAQQAVCLFFGSVPPKLDPEERSFDVTVVYPSNPSLPNQQYDTRVEWLEDSGLLNLYIAVDGVAVAPWAGIDRFLETLNRRITLLLPEIKGGCGKIMLFDSREDLTKGVPGHMATFRYNGPGTQGTEAFEEAFLPVYARAIQALYFTHPLFRYIAATGEEPNAEAQMRLLLIEYGKSEVFRTPAKEEQSPHVVWPPGLYGGIEIPLRQ